MLTKPDGIISYLSPACEKVLGHDPKDLLGQQPWIIHPNDLENVKKIHNKALEGKVGTNIEYRIKTRSDETKWISHSFSPVFTDDKFQMLVSVIRDITERKHTEEALNENEERYRRLVEYSPIAIAVQSEGKIRFANESCLKLFGASSPEQIIGKPVMDFVHPDFREIVTKRISSMVRENRYIKPLEEKFLRLDGEIIDVEVAAIPFVYEGKTAIHVVISNITERKHAEEALRESEEKYRTLIDNNRNGVFIIQDGKMHFVNDAFAKMVGYSTDEIKGMDFKELIAPEDLETVADRYRRRQAGEDVPKEYEFHLLHKDGHTRVFVNMSVGLIEYCGRVASMGTLMDITERKKAEKALQESENSLRTLFNAMTDVVLELDYEGRYINIAPTSPNLLYKPVEETIGKTLHELFPKSEADEFLSVIRKCLDGNKIVKTEYPLVIKDQIIWFEGRATPKSKNTVLFIAHDITERKKAEEELKESEKRYRILFESTIDGLFVLNAETKKIVLANHTTAKMYGFDSAEEIVGVNLLDFIHTEDRARAIRIIEKDMFEKNLHRIEEFRTITKDGRELWVSIIGTRIEYQRKLAGLISIRNITEHKQAERKYINQLKNLLNIGTKMRMELKLENLLQNICDLIVKSLGWRQVILSLRDYDMETSKPVALAGYDEKTTKDTLSKPPTLIKETSKFFIDKFKISNSFYIDHTNLDKLKEYPAEVVVIPIEDSKPEG
jgi:PAS domain S-box-containing protein